MRTLILEMEKRDRKEDNTVVPNVKLGNGEDADYWERDAEKWTRVHVRPRYALCVPFLIPGGPFAAGSSRR